VNRRFFLSFLLPKGEKKKMRGQVAIPHPLILTLSPKGRGELFI
jgi:hypothetical protein